MTTFSDRHKLQFDLQSACRRQHNTDTVVSKKLFLTFYREETLARSHRLQDLLNICAAFDAVNHVMLLDVSMCHLASVAWSCCMEPA